MYDWQGKEAECYQLYVEERRSLTEVMTYFKERYDFGPSKRAWQTQIRKWSFPAKLHPAWQNDTLVARVRQLWEQNRPAKQMLATLQHEGFDVKERDLMRLRSKHKWFLRGNSLSGALRDGTAATSNQLDALTAQILPNASSSNMVAAQSGSKKRKRRDRQTVAGVTESVLVELHAIDGAAPSTVCQSSSSELDPEIRQKRHERLAQLAVESEERLASKKRRRRTRGWAGLPADPPQAPRFPSETTIDESKAYLHLDSSQWATVRTQFTAICRDAGVKKKTTAGTEKWQTVKDRLVRENPHLHNEFFGSTTEHTQENKVLGLDVLCLDIVKRLRSLDTRMTLGEARNVLGLNPAQAEQAREDFRAILRADRFVSKLATGERRWKELQQQWIQSQPILQTNIPLPISSLHLTPQSPILLTRLRAMEILTTDIMKRLREEQNKADPEATRTKYSDNIHNSPGPGPPEADLPEGRHGRRQLGSMQLAPRDTLLSNSAPPNQQHMQELMQQLAESPLHPQPSHPQYQSAVPSILGSGLSTAENHLREGLQQFSSFERQSIVSQHNGQIDPFLLAVANSNEWSVDELGGGGGMMQATAERLQAYAASASRD